MEKVRNHIAIIGGGISGLTTLHYLKKKFKDQKQIDIKLFEQNGHVGGTIRTERRNGYSFEIGPNGFLDSKQRTLDLVDDLGLTKDLQKTSDTSKLRFISIKDQLIPFPTDPRSFLTSPLLNAFQKLRVCAEPLIGPSGDEQESIYEFGVRRFGKRFTELFFDAFVKGIYGGDIHKLNLKASFPRIYELEQKYGSLFMAMMKTKRSKTGSQLSKNKLTSFRLGMSQIINCLENQHRTNILLNQEIRSISHNDDQYVIYSGDHQYTADQLFICTPAYSASRLLHGLNPQLAESLAQIQYVPIAVVGLGYSVSDFQEIPPGFGYLVPSCQKRKALGVLFEHNIFPDRAPGGSILFRVMLGGSEHRGIVKLDQEEICRYAEDEVNKCFKINQKPKETFFFKWPNAIPQYGINYLSVIQSVEAELSKRSGLHLVANYIGGIAFNDCIERAFQAAQKSTLRV